MLNLMKYLPQLTVTCNNFIPTSIVSQHSVLQDDSKHNEVTPSTNNVIRRQPATVANQIEHEIIDLLRQDIPNEGMSDTVNKLQNKFQGRQHG